MILLFDLVLVFWECSKSLHGVLFPGGQRGFFHKVKSGGMLFCMSLFRGVHFRGCNIFCARFGGVATFFARMEWKIAHASTDLFLNNPFGTVQILYNAILGVFLNPPPLTHWPPLSNALEAHRHSFVAAPLKCGTWNIDFTMFTFLLPQICFIGNMELL